MRFIGATTLALACACGFRAHRGMVIAPRTSLDEVRPGSKVVPWSPSSPPDRSQMPRSAPRAMTASDVHLTFDRPRAMRQEPKTPTVADEKGRYIAGEFMRPAEGGRTIEHTVLGLHVLFVLSSTPSRPGAKLPPC